ncbi:hypothetical protein [Deinococcus knuensis]|uniref:hypothetical protein n=1 Tax=Deinococcus knuensis TaxID=1837380 RepID=UPI003570B596
MGGLPLEIARAAANGLLTRLGPDDRVTLATFSGGPVLHAPLQPVGDGRALQAHLSSLRATGGTALHAGRMSCGEEGHRREEQHSSRSTFSRGCGARGI